MRYTESSIDRIRNADIYKTVSSFIELKKQGTVYKGLSPFTSEKTPSFVVSQAKQIFKCFSSGHGGDAIKFVMLKNSCDFIEAIKTIAKIHNIFLEKEEVTPEIKRKIEIKSEMYRVLELVSTSYVNAFKNLSEKHWAKQLIENERKFSKGSVIEFQIGYAPEGNKLTKWSINNGTLQVTKELGLSRTKNASSYDIFKDRVMFPIHNEKGVVVGFGGRQSNNEELDKSYKYINSKESPVYDKSSLLYGLFQAKQVILEKGSAILTEGYTDVISMHQHGCENTVSTSGTALSVKQALLIKKYATEVIILRDSDPAGEKATLNDIDICLSEGLIVSLCILPEGEDPDSFARTNKNMPQWIQNNKQDALLWKVQRYDFKRENYDSEVQEIKKTSAFQIKALQDCFVDINNIKAEEIEQVKEENKKISKEISHIRKETEKEINNLPTIDPNKKTKAVTEITKTLFKIKNEVKRNEYCKLISKALKVSYGALKNEIGKLEIEKNKEKLKNDGEKLSIKKINLPKGADQQEFLEGHGFITIENSYYFHRYKNNDFVQGTTFKLEPLFHIQGDKENKRLCEITNQRGKKKLIDFDSDMLANFNEFRKYLFKIGGFMFLTHNGIKTEDFDKFVYRYEEQFEPALELLSLGWNKKGFFAFANGVFWEGKFRSTNKYGIMHLEGIDKTENDYNQKIDYYYSPAFSVMHQNNQEQDDKYENDRFFVYKESAISLTEWMKQMIIVFQEKAFVGILFVFGAAFRDLFLSLYDFFPLLGGFGEKDSGKSGFGKIIQNFFYFRLPPLDLTQATHVGFSRRMSRNTNTVQFADEYQDRNVKEEIFNGLMGAWNGIGREKGKGVGTNRTSYDRVNSAIYYAGQFMPTKMENALATRTIMLLFESRNFTPDEKSEYNKLLNQTNSGISSLVVEIIKHRNYFEKRLPMVYAESERTLKEILKEKQYQERIFGNVSMLFTTYQILKNKVNFPFSEKQITNICVKLIVENSEQIIDSNGIADFWNIITFLFERGQITTGLDFVIDKAPSFKIHEKDSESTYKNSNGDQILYLRFDSVYQYYNKEVTIREGVDIIGKITLRQYFRSRSYFIGRIRGKRFGKAGVKSCFAFNYTKMKTQGMIGLEQDSSPVPPVDYELTNKIDTDVAF